MDPKDVPSALPRGNRAGACAQPIGIARLAEGLARLQAADRPATACRLAAELLAEALVDRGVHVQLRATSSDDPAAGWSAGAGPEMSSVLRSLTIETGAGELLGEVVIDGGEVGGRELDTDLLAISGIVTDACAAVAARFAARERQRRTTRGFAMTLARVALAREGVSVDRLERLSWLCGALARESGYLTDEAEIALLEEACVLHDVGKVAIPDAILLKPGSLTAEEWRIMRSHSVQGAQLLDEAAKDVGSDLVLETGRMLALSHHERWDGTGYPEALAGEETPVMARIVGIADAWEALTSTRSYRAAWSHERALGWITGRAGRSFDPRLVAALGRLEGELHRRERASDPACELDAVWR